MSSELFESREDDLRHICENVRRKLTDQLPRCAGGGFCCCRNTHTHIAWSPYTCRTEATGSGIRVRASVQKIPHFVGRLGSEVRVSASFQIFD